MRLILPQNLWRQPTKRSAWMRTLSLIRAGTGRPICASLAPTGATSAERESGCPARLQHPMPASWMPFSGSRLPVSPTVVLRCCPVERDALASTPSASPWTPSVGVQGNLMLPRLDDGLIGKSSNLPKRLVSMLLHPQRHSQSHHQLHRPTPRPLQPLGALPPPHLQAVVENAAGEDAAIPAPPIGAIVERTSVTVVAEHGALGTASARWWLCEPCLDPGRVHAALIFSQALLWKLSGRLL